MNHKSVEWNLLGQSRNNNSYSCNQRFLFYQSWNNWMRKFCLGSNQTACKVKIINIFDSFGNDTKSILPKFIIFLSKKSLPLPPQFRWTFSLNCTRWRITYNFNNCKFALGKKRWKLLAFFDENLECTTKSRLRVKRLW